MHRGTGDASKGRTLMRRLAGVRGGPACDHRGPWCEKRTSRVAGKRWRRALAGIVTLCASLVAAEPLRIAVASNFQTALAQLGDGFPGEFVATYGSSGLLYAQVVQGRPFDVFLSADRARPMALIDDNRAKTPITYATGRLVLLVNDGIPGPAWFQTDDRRVAIANPEAAPYGRAALETIAGLDVALARITGLNVAQAFHFAASGAADGAFVALAQVVAREIPRERYWIVPENLHSPIEQVGVILVGPNEAAAQAFLDYLGGAQARARIREAGYR